MKKLTLLFVAIAFYCGAQITPTVYINSPLPESICAGDSLSLCLKVVGDNTLHASNGYEVSVYLSNSDTIIYYPIIDNRLFYTNLTVCDSGRIAKIFIPLTLQAGSAQIYSSGTSFTITILKCYTGIIEYQLSQPDPVYYDFYGHITTPQPGQFLIRQIGRTREKVLITN